ncbi:MAG: hypothetical protein IT376_09655 [Polyangiaceae bacterium]|nr:hypothetical protein [Polyangiaceae bacterium]
MIGRLGRRATEALVLLFAALGFVLVPLGSRTGLEHARAVLSTPEARVAGAELWAAAAGIRARLLAALGDRQPPPAPRPAPAGSAAPPALASPTPQLPDGGAEGRPDASVGS